MKKCCLIIILIIIIATTLAVSYSALNVDYIYKNGNEIVCNSRI